MAAARVIVIPDEVIGTINPNIYGHFAEHLGKMPYMPLARVPYYTFVGRKSAS